MTTLLRSTGEGPRRGAPGEAGFTLIEALMAIVILAFGLIAVTNLFLVAGTSNQSANHSTATVAQATEVMEALKAIPFNQLVQGGTCDVTYTLKSGTEIDHLGCDSGAGAKCEPKCGASADGKTAEPCPTQCVQPGNFNYYRTIPGIGTIKTRWRIIQPGQGGPNTYFVQVRSESLSPLVGGARSRAEFSTFRTCTSVGCTF